MQQPLFLRTGDTIGIIAPSRKISAETLYPAVKLFESWGLKVLLGKNIYAEENQFAGSDSMRHQDLQDMLDNPAVNAIICARGGYGTIRIVEGLNFDLFLQHPKWIIGYSDITVLHSVFNIQLDCATIHGIMPVNYNLKDGETASWEKLRLLMFGQLPVYRTEPHPFNKIGKASGKLVGGNLSVLYSMAGTPYDIHTTGCILFLEDLDEYLYHIDRMMMNLKLSGKLEHLKGLVVGGMSDMKDNNIPFGKNAEQIINSYMECYDYPVLFDFPAGHIDSNYPLIMGKNAEMEISETGGQLKFI
jgi:muramoyltetrapeptide carboxypeptidase